MSVAAKITIFCLVHFSQFRPLSLYWWQGREGPRAEERDWRITAAPALAGTAIFVSSDTFKTGCFRTVLHTKVSPREGAEELGTLHNSSILQVISAALTALQEEL